MKRRYRIHILLFALTVVSTLIAGALQKGVNIISEPWRIVEGIPFCISLIAILLAHELSHFFASRHHHTEATLPYFIPAPSIIGTFGAFIKMKSPIITRKALIDIGASGPIAGFIVAVIVTIIGLNGSEVITIKNSDVGLMLGDSLLFSLLTKVVIGTPPEGKDILLSPVAFAGWIGFFVTSMNLLPIGQLDGGHIAYALLGESRHRKTSILFATLLGLAGIGRLYLYSGYFDGTPLASLRDYLWEGWAVWAFLLLMLGLRHPPVLYWEEPLDGKRRFVGWVSLIIFFLTFTPVPFRM
ncbi:MAG: site-2 protease family protein [Nitrospirae bacterium]|nr:MAG: site-2 protease family protein [Nitrospirota bacterium]